MLNGASSQHTSRIPNHLKMYEIAIAYHTTFLIPKQRTEKGFNIAMRPINIHNQGGIQS
jgi:hypothetical protein